MMRLKTNGSWPVISIYLQKILHRVRRMSWNHYTIFHIHIWFHTLVANSDTHCMHLLWYTLNGPDKGCNKQQLRYNWMTDVTDTSSNIMGVQTYFYFMFVPLAILNKTCQSQLLWNKTDRKWNGLKQKVTRKQIITKFVHETIAKNNSYLNFLK